MTLAQHIANFCWPIAIVAAFSVFVVCKRNQIEWGESDLSAARPENPGTVASVVAAAVPGNDLEAGHG